MKVRATMTGYYGEKRRKVDEVFELKPITLRYGKGNEPLEKPVTLTPEQQFSKRWMEKVEPVAARKSAVREPERIASGDEEVI